MYLFAPIAWPIAKLLDHVLGANETHTYKKAELKSFLQFHRTGEEPLRDDEISILNGVLELNTKNVETIMTPIKDVLTLCVDTIMDHATVDAMHVHHCRDNASSDHPITSSDSTAAIREYLYTSQAIHLLSGGSFSSRSSSPTTPQRRSQCPISNSQYCQKHVHLSTVFRHWITFKLDVRIYC
ncbi:hypothetical protein OG21DRAFT_606273 [Imleria badia]|nr:hypothetical protein OG21DRAFT_606273 [Imleria badia]